MLSHIDTMLSQNSGNNILLIKLNKYDLTSRYSLYIIILNYFKMLLIR